MIDKIKMVDIKTVFLNPNNPRTIKDKKFNTLVKSIKDFPEMLNVRPIVVNKDMVVLGGNMRFRACQELKYKKIPIIKVDHLTKEQQAEFVIKDNSDLGDWNYEELANNFDPDLLKDWGLDLTVPKVNFDPNLHPESNGNTITEGDIEKTEEKLDSNFSDKKKAVQDIICPDCNYEFQIEK